MRSSYLQPTDGHVPIGVVRLMVRMDARRDGNEALCQSPGCAISHEVKHVPRREVLECLLRHSSLRYDGNGEEGVPNRVRVPNPGPA